MIIIVDVLVAADLSSWLLHRRRLLNVDWSTLAAPCIRHPTMTPIALTTATCPHLLRRVHLAEIFEVDFHNFLHQALHLGFVLDDLCDIDNLLSL